MIADVNVFVTNFFILCVVIPEHIIATLKPFSTTLIHNDNMFKNPYIFILTLRPALSTICPDTDAPMHCARASIMPCWFGDRVRPAPGTLPAAPNIPPANVRTARDPFISLKPHTPITMKKAFAVILSATEKTILVKVIVNIIMN